MAILPRRLLYVQLISLLHVFVVVYGKAYLSPLLVASQVGSDLAMREVAGSISGHSKSPKLEPVVPQNKFDAVSRASQLPPHPDQSVIAFIAVILNP